jgi:hypothetical protein
MALEPVLITDRPHLLQGSAAHACREFASFPGESGTKSDRATQHTPRNRFWKAIATAVRVEAQDAGAGSNGSQA